MMQLKRMRSLQSKKKKRECIVTASARIYTTCWLLLFKLSLSISLIEMGTRERTNKETKQSTYINRSSGIK